MSSKSNTGIYTSQSSSHSLLPLLQVIRTLQCETGKVPPSYEEDFQKAESTFLYQLVFDPRSQSQVRLHPLPQDMSSQDIEFAGV